MEENIKTNAKNAIAAYCSNVGAFFNNNGSVIFAGQDPHLVPVLSQVLENGGVREQRISQCVQDDREFFRIVGQSIENGFHPFVIIEYLQPKNRGLSLVKALCSRYADIPVIILASSENRNTRMLFSEFDCENVIVKPVNVNSLMILVSDMLATPSAERMLHQKALEFVRARSYDKAMAIVKVIERAKPASVDNYVIMGDILNAKGDCKKAMECYGRASEINPSHVKPYLKMADIVKKLDNTEKELEILSRLDTLSPFNAERKIRIGEIYLENGEIAQAMNCLNSVIPYLDDETNVKAQKFALEVATSCETDYPQIEKALRHSISLKKGIFDESDAKIFTLLETALLKQGKKEKAVRESGKALDILPNSPELHYNFARLMFENGDIATGSSHLLKIMADNPEFAKTSADIAFNMGWMLMKAGEDNEALDCFEKCLAIDPNRRQSVQFIEQIRERKSIIE